MTYLLSVLAILGLEVLVAALIWLWWQTLKNQQEQFHLKTKDTYAKLAQMVEDTARESHQALTSALKTAESLESDVQKQSQALADHAQETIKKQTEWQNTTNQKLWVAYQDTLNQETKAAGQQLNHLLTEQATRLNQQVTQSLQETQQTLRQNLESDLKQAQSDIESYKKAEVDRIHAAAQQISHEVISDIIGRELSPTDQHELVLAQLTKALTTLKSWNEYKITSVESSRTLPDE